MPGLIQTDDHFTGLANNTTIVGRVPPVTDTSSSYVVDPNSAAATGDGLGFVKFSTSGTAAKIRASSPNNAVQIVIDDKGGNEDMSIFIRDTFTTPYPRDGYGFRWKTRSAGTSGVFSALKYTNYNGAFLGGFNNTPWVFDASGINVIAFEGINNNFRMIINGVVAGTFTDASFPATNTSATRVGVAFHSTGPSVLRLDRLTIYDSVVITAQQEFPIVRFA